MEMGHPQPPTPIHIDNSTCVGIVNGTIKRQRSRAMENRYFWLLDQEAQKYFRFCHHPGAENMGDYPSKAHTGPMHEHVRPWVIQMKNSPTELPRASFPSARWGCAEMLASPYHKGIPLPRIPLSRELHSRDDYLPQWHSFLPFPILPRVNAATWNGYCTCTHDYNHIAPIICAIR